MKALEKRDYIHSHLHRTDEDFVNEVYQKMYSIIEENNPIVGYDGFGNPIKKTQFLADIEEAERQIERGEYISLEELEEESKLW